MPTGQLLLALLSTVVTAPSSSDITTAMTALSTGSHIESSGSSIRVVPASLVSAGICTTQPCWLGANSKSPMVLDAAARGDARHSIRSWRLWHGKSMTHDRNTDLVREDVLQTVPREWYDLARWQSNQFQVIPKADLPVYGYPSPVTGLYVLWTVDGMRWLLGGEWEKLRGKLGQPVWSNVDAAVRSEVREALSAAGGNSAVIAAFDRHTADRSAETSSTDQLMLQLTRLSIHDRAEIIQRLLESMPAAADPDAPGGDDPVSRSLTAATGTFRVRAERDTPPDIRFDGDSDNAHWMRLLDGSMWAYDFDSIVRLSDTSEGRPQFGFTRILQIIAKVPACGAASSPALTSQPAEVTVLSAQPPWAEPLARWYSETDSQRGFEVPCYPHCTPILTRYRYGGLQFWSEVECRIWQFSEPRVKPEPQTLWKLHDVLVGGYQPRDTRMRGDFYTTFSSSLLVSGWQALGFGNEAVSYMNWDLYELGCDASASTVQALLPFYEAMRQRQKARGHIVADGVI